MDFLMGSSSQYFFHNQYVRNARPAKVLRQDTRLAIKIENQKNYLKRWYTSNDRPYSGLMALLYFAGDMF